MDRGAGREPRVSRSSKAVKGKQKVEAKRARPAVKRRAVPERMRSDKVIHGAGNYGTNESHDNAGEAVALATNDVPTTNDQSLCRGPPPAAGAAARPDRSDSLQRLDTVARAAALYPQATATALAALQAWFLLPLRILQSWQEAWFWLLPR
jgi:hypothetical protein